MTETLSVFDALSMIPNWDPMDVDVEELHGGQTNRTYQVRYRELDYVLRLDSLQSRLFQFDRSLEVKILANAHAAGIGPEVFYSDADAGVLLREFLPGRAWEEADLSSPEKLESMANVIRRGHEMPQTGIPIGLVGYASAYEKVLERRDGLHAFATECVAIVGSVSVRDDAVCGHNDIVASNVIESAGLKLIDWEYACDSDPMFDLASAIGYHNLSEVQSNVLLSAYLGGDSPEWRERLTDQIRVYDAIQWLWLASRHLVMPNSIQARRLEELQKRIK
jgi:thiamine kinase-like enzyme